MQDMHEEYARRAADAAALTTLEQQLRAQEALLPAADANAPQDAQDAQPPQDAPDTQDMQDTQDAQDAQDPQDMQDDEAAAPQDGHIFKSAQEYSAHLARKAQREVSRARKAWEAENAPRERVSRMAGVLAEMLGEQAPESAMQRLLVSTIAAQRGVDEATAQELAEARLEKAGCAHPQNGQAQGAQPSVDALTRRALHEQQQVLASHPEMDEHSLVEFTKQQPDVWRLMAAGFAMTDAVDIALLRSKKAAPAPPAQAAKVPQPHPTGGGGFVSTLTASDVERIDALVKRGVAVHLSPAPR